MTRLLRQVQRILRECGRRAAELLRRPVYVGRYLNRVPVGAVVFFPCRGSFLSCGLSGIVAVKGATVSGDAAADLKSLSGFINHAAENLLVGEGAGVVLAPDYLGGRKTANDILAAARRLKEPDSFYSLFSQRPLLADVMHLWERLSEMAGTQETRRDELLGRLAPRDAERMTLLIDALKDAAWCLKTELSDNIEKVDRLMGVSEDIPQKSAVSFYREMNAVLNSIDRLEVRGRDSAGISLMFFFPEDVFRKFETVLAGLPAGGQGTLRDQFTSRSAGEVLLNHCIGVHCSTDSKGDGRVAVTMTYKVAAEIGSLGDNVRFLRKQIEKDDVLKALTRHEHNYHTISSHTRWASVGAINEGNCHPLDNRAKGPGADSPIIHACLNGDIDNYLSLRESLAKTGIHIHEEITTDTKIIPLQIEKYIRAGEDALEAFRLAVNDFDGSHAISMQTDLAPGKLFLAQRGSGQAIFIGLAESHYMPTSEVYGFVEETSRYLKIDGEKVGNGKNGSTRGQIFVLDQDSGGGLGGIQAMYYDTTPITLGESDIHCTELTSRDIDRQGYPHYFLKEISESPASVERTLQNRWRIDTEGEKRFRTVLDESVVSDRLKKSLRGEAGSVPVRRIFFIGQGTAGVAAQACANIMNYYLNDPFLIITPLKASELSGFGLGDEAAAGSMADVLVVAISQSGTTTDTNRAVDMVKALGARTLAIVNRRDSDLTFKADGVLYTSSGRDIEMSVASTKAFYSQIIAGALLGLHFAELKGRRGPEFIARELKHLLAIPGQMRQVLTLRQPSMNQPNVWRP